MIVTEVNLYEFWEYLKADPYSDYSFEAAEWIFHRLEEYAGACNDIWMLDLPAIRGTFTEVPADEWNDFQEVNQVDWYGKIRGGYIVEHQY